MNMAHTSRRPAHPYGKKWTALLLWLLSIVGIIGNITLNVGRQNPAAANHLVSGGGIITFASAFDTDSITNVQHAKAARNDVSSNQQQQLLTVSSSAVSIEETLIPRCRRILLRMCRNCKRGFKRSAKRCASMGGCERRFDRCISGKKRRFRTKCYKVRDRLNWERYFDCTLSDRDREVFLQARGTGAGGDVTDAASGADFDTNSNALPNNDICINAGGMVSTATCCIGQVFPNTCGLGACGCAADYSEPTLMCNCPADQCWNGEACVVDPATTSAPTLIPSASPSSSPTTQADRCTNSGGVVGAADCCVVISDFPNLCVGLKYGFCGPSNVCKGVGETREATVCDCPVGKCFDGNSCVESAPTDNPSSRPSNLPTGIPSTIPSTSPSIRPSTMPSSKPSISIAPSPANEPSSTPTMSSKPSSGPTPNATGTPSSAPSAVPSLVPSILPTKNPSSPPSISPAPTSARRPSSSPSKSFSPSDEPSQTPSANPSLLPSTLPSIMPSVLPSASPSSRPSAVPSSRPSMSPSISSAPSPELAPSESPTLSVLPSSKPSLLPSGHPSLRPSKLPSQSPTTLPSVTPTLLPSSSPSISPSGIPSSLPSAHPSGSPSRSPSLSPSLEPSKEPSLRPSNSPSQMPSTRPSLRPSKPPSANPSTMPSLLPSSKPSAGPSESPSSKPILMHSDAPSRNPSVSPSDSPTVCLDLEESCVDGDYCCPHPLGISTTISCNFTENFPGRSNLHCCVPDGNACVIDGSLGLAHNGCCDSKCSNETTGVFRCCVEQGDECDPEFNICCTGSCSVTNGTRGTCVP